MQICDVMKVEVPPTADGRAASTVTRSGLGGWALVSGVLVGGEGGEGGRGGERQGAGLRTDSSPWRRVCRRL